MIAVMILSVLAWYQRREINRLRESNTHLRETLRYTQDQLFTGGVNRNRTNVPRGAVCLWNNAADDDAGHIAIVDGKGNSVNKMSS